MDRLSDTNRVAAVRRYLQFEEDLPSSLSRITELATFLSGFPFAAVHLFEDQDMHQVAGVRVPLGISPAREALCHYVVLDGARITTEDATHEPRFAGSPFIEPPDAIRAYSSHPLRDLEGNVLGTLCVFDDVPGTLDDQRLRMLDHLADEVVASLELTRAAKDLAHSATHDALTGLPNRTLVTDRLEHALSQRARGRLALAMVDLDGFKQLNDGLGHAAGDGVLQQVATRLIDLTRHGDTVARFGGDEFVIVVEDLEPGGEQVVLNRLQHAFDEPLRLGRTVVPMRASVGLALAETGDTVDTLLSRADRAMYADKSSHVAG